MGQNNKLKLDHPNLLVEYSEEVDRAFKTAVKAALLKHKRLNNPVAVWRDNRVVLLLPDEIEPDEN